MENKNTPPTQGNKKNNNLIWIILFALSVAFNIYQWQSNNASIENYEVKTDSLVAAKVDVEKELAETYQELNQYKGINERLDSLLAEANENIQKYEERINKLQKSERNSAALNKKLKAEVEELKKLRDEYLEKIDQLLVENEQLKKDKQELTSTVENLSKNLEATVNQASVLKSEYIRVKAFKKKGSNKYAETAMAKRTNKMEVCFTVLENKIAQAGEKNVYLRIVEPGGKTMGERSGGSSTFNITGSTEQVQYTATTRITYANSKMDQCLNWEEQERIFSPGTYVIEVYIDGNLSAASSYVLK